MTATLAEDSPPPGGWSTDDLDGLPEDGQRRELIDGVLFASPSPTSTHQIIVFRLCSALDLTRPPDLTVTQGVEVRVSRRRSLIPDVLVTTAEASRRGARQFAPHEVILAIEVVSPTSTTMDRITKPALYAGARIPYYWRVETEDGIEVHAYRLDADAEVYVPVGTFTDAITVDEPWQIRIPLDRIASEVGT